MATYRVACSHYPFAFDANILFLFFFYSYFLWLTDCSQRKKDNRTGRFILPVGPNMCCCYCWIICLIGLKYFSSCFLGLFIIVELSLSLRMPEFGFSSNLFVAAPFFLADSIWDLPWSHQSIRFICSSLL